MILELQNICFGYNGKSDILKNVSLRVKPGEVLSLVGPNGSGKTTLLKCINRIHKPKSGNLMLDGEGILKMNARKLARNLGYVPQNAPGFLPLTVFDMILLGRKPYVGWRTGQRDRQIVFDMLEVMGLSEMAFRMFGELSGGEKQKVLMARAFAQQPQVLLLDEPTSNLDLKHQMEVLELVRCQVEDRGLMAVMAIHDLNLAMRFSDRIVMLKNGGIHACGSVSEILNPDNIRAVYGIEAAIYHDSGNPYIVPLGPSGGRSGANILDKPEYEPAAIS